MERKLKKHKQLRTPQSIEISNEESIVTYVQCMNTIKVSNSINSPYDLKRSVSLTNIRKSENNSNLYETHDVNTQTSQTYQSDLLAYKERSISIKSTSLDALTIPSTVTLMATCRSQIDDIANCETSELFSDSSVSFCTVKSKSSSNLSVKTCFSVTSFFKSSDITKNVDEHALNDKSNFYTFTGNNSKPLLFSKGKTTHQYKNISQPKKKINSIPKINNIVTQTPWSVTSTQTTFMPCEKNSVHILPEPISKSSQISAYYDKGLKPYQPRVTNNEDSCAANNSNCSNVPRLKVTKPKPIRVREKYTHKDSELYQSYNKSNERLCSVYDVCSDNTPCFEKETAAQAKLTWIRGEHTRKDTNAYQKPTRCKDTKLQQSYPTNNKRFSASCNIYFENASYAEGASSETLVPLETSAAHIAEENIKLFNVSSGNNVYFADGKHPSVKGATDQTETKAEKNSSSRTDSSNNSLSNVDIASALALKKLNEILTDIKDLNNLEFNKGKGDSPVYAHETINKILKQISNLKEHLSGISTLLPPVNFRKFDAQLQDAFFRVQRLKKKILTGDKKLCELKLHFKGGHDKIKKDVENLPFNRSSYASTPTSTKKMFKKKYRNIINSNTELSTASECSTIKNCNNYNETISFKPHSNILTIQKTASIKEETTTSCRLVQNNKNLHFHGDKSNSPEVANKLRQANLKISPNYATPKRSQTSIYNIFQHEIRKKQKLNAQISTRTFIIDKPTPTEQFTMLQSPTPFVSDVKFADKDNNEFDNGNEIARRTDLNSNTRNLTGRFGLNCFHQTNDNKLQTSFHSNSHIVVKGEEINGKDIFINNIRNSIIEIQGTPNSLEFRDAWNCVLACGPVSGPIEIVNCDESVLMLAGKNLNIKSSSLCFFLIYITERTVLKKSTGLLIGPYSFCYSEIENDFNKAGLSTMEKKFQIIDYSNKSKRNSTNWGPLPECDVPNWDSVKGDFKRHVYSKFRC